MRSKTALSVVISLVMIAGCASSSGMKPVIAAATIDHSSSSLPLNPANIDFDLGEVEDHEATIVPVVKEVKHCVDGMIFVSGEYCPVVQETCLYFVDTHGNKIPETKRWPGRCGEYKAPTKCLSTKKVHKEFCIDKFEYPNVEGQRPQSWMSWYDAKKVADGIGKRLCTHSEWTMSCEGPDMHPYPYGDGFHRDITACNFDQSTKGIDVFSCTPHRDGVSGKIVAPAVDAPCRKQLDSLLVPSGSMPRCVSPWGVFDQVANIDEFVINETGHPYKSGLVGGHVFGVRNACRPMTEAHNESFAWYETGTRFCSNVAQ